MINVVRDTSQMDERSNLAKLLEATLNVKPVFALGGYYALESLRLKREYRAWGHDIGSDALSFTVNEGEENTPGQGCCSDKEKRCYKTMLRTQLTDVEFRLILILSSGGIAWGRHKLHWVYERKGVWGLERMMKEEMRVRMGCKNILDAKSRHITPATKTCCRRSRYTPNSQSP